MTGQEKQLKHISERATQPTKTLEEKALQKAFIISSVNRKDILELLGATNEQVAALTDKDMRAIAKALEDIYVDENFLYDLREVVNNRLKQKNLAEIPEAEE